MGISTSEPIRVLHVIGIMNRGGAETMIMNLYRHIDRNKVQFDFVENSGESAAFDEEILHLGGRIYRCPHYNGKNYFAYVKWWSDFFRTHQKEYPIVHGHLGSTAAIYLSIAKRYGAYTIAHSHNSGTDRGIKTLLYKVISYNTRNVADYFFACSTPAGLDRFGNKIVNGECYSLLNNAIEIAKFSFRTSTRAAMRRKFGLTDELAVGHVGRFNQQKNHPFLLEIFAALLKKEPNAVLLLVGGGTDMQKMQAKAQTLGIAEKVRFLGIRSDVADVMQAMDVFVFPSLYEGLPVTMVEAQASGLPCLISDKVPSECVLTNGLVEKVPLSESPDVWAEKIIAKYGTPRTDRRTEIAAQGFDINTEAVKLQEFYINAYERKN